MSDPARHRDGDVHDDGDRGDDDRDHHSPSVDICANDHPIHGDGGHDVPTLRLRERLIPACRRGQRRDHHAPNVSPRRARRTLPLRFLDASGVRNAGDDLRYRYLRVPIRTSKALLPNRLKLQPSYRH